MTLSWLLFQTERVHMTVLISVSDNGVHTHDFVLTFVSECAHTWLSWLLFQIRECTHDCPFVSDCVHMTVLTSVLEFVRMTVLTCVLNRGFTHDSVLKFVSNRACTHDCPDICFKQGDVHMTVLTLVSNKGCTHDFVLTSVSNKACKYDCPDFCFRQGVYIWLCPDFCFKQSVCTWLSRFLSQTMGCTYEFVLTFVSNRVCTNCPDFCFRQWGVHMTVLTSVSDKGMYTWLSFCFRQGLYTWLRPDFGFRQWACNLLCLNLIETNRGCARGWPT